MPDIPWDTAITWSRQAPPDGWFQMRLELIARAATIKAAGLMRLDADDLVLWDEAPLDPESGLSHELRPGANRPGPRSLWDQFDAQVRGLAAATEVGRAGAIASALNELAITVHVIASSSSAITARRKLAPALTRAVGRRRSGDMRPGARAADRRLAQLARAPGASMYHGAPASLREYGRARRGHTNKGDTEMALTWPLEHDGSTGEDVKTVQYLVTANGHPTGVDGDFGAQTKAAVMAFQSSRGLAADGVVGPQTWPQLIITVPGGK